MPVSPLFGHPKPYFPKAENGSVEFYVGGGATPLDTYTSSTGLVANANPVLLNARAEPDNQIHGTDGVSYKAVLKDSEGATIWTEDVIYSVNSTVATATTQFLNATLEKTGAYTVAAADEGKLIDCTANTFTVTLLAAATATEGFVISVYNSGSGVVTIDGDAAELINGAATLVLQAGGWAHITTDGIEWTATTYEPATDAEAQTGTDTSKLVTSANLATIANYGAAATGFTKATNTYFGDDGPLSTGFDVDTNIAAAWETIGPTGSGATNIWTDLDNIPANAKAVLIRGKATIEGASADTYSATAYFRPGGSVRGPSNSSELVDAYGVNTSAGSETFHAANECWVKVDSSLIFELYYVTQGTGSTASAFIYITGFAV